MAGEPKGRGGAEETLLAEALPAVEDEVQSLIRMHQKIAARLLREGSPSRAFGELVRATRAAPLNRRLAASIVWLSLRAGTEAAAVTLLNAGIEENDGSEKVAIRRQLIRLLRRLGELDRAGEHLKLILEERPMDRRSRAVLAALLERRQRWQELDAALDHDVRDAVARQAWLDAAKASLRRARICHERLFDPARAALRYAQAAQYTEDAGNLEGSLNLRMLWLRALQAANSPPRALSEAGEALLKLAAKVGKQERARALVAELAIPVSTAEAPAPAPRRSTTQRTLVAAADEAEARGANAEAAALLVAAVQEGPDDKARRRLEAHYVARGAWRELSSFYRDAADRAAQKEQKVDYLGKLAELLEDELHDTDGAAQAYGEIVELSGDRRALDEQVRLLSAREDLSGVRRALDEAVTRARDPAARSQALVARAEAAFARRDAKSARADFEEAVRLQPGNVLARAGLAEVAALSGERAPAFAFREALSRFPKRKAGRADLFRRLARLADSPLQDAILSRAAWTEVLAEAPDDEEAHVRLTALARDAKDLGQLEPLLRGQIRLLPRGPRTRLARLELVHVLEQKGQKDEALAELRTAVQFEPGHREAWAQLADRCIARGINSEAAWALEQVATSTEDELERQRTWVKLAEFCEKVLREQERARTYAARAEKLKSDIEQTARERQEAAAAKGRAEPRTEVEMPKVDLDEEPPDVMELTTGDVLPLTDAVELARRNKQLETWEAPPGKDDEEEEPPFTAEAPVAEEDEVSSSNPRALVRTELFAFVRAHPLDPAGFRELSDHFDHEGDATRSVLMTEIADALQGDPDAAPRAPKLMLSATDRAGLRHPSLRTEAGELLALCGLALCRLFPARGRHAGAREEFGLDSGRGAQSAADALLAAVRILGLRAPDVHLSEDNGPPFSLVFVSAPRLLVGRLAVKKELPEAELRFFAGRALFTQNPDLLALRTLKRDQLGRALIELGAVVRGGKDSSAEARAIKDALSTKSLGRIAELYTRVGRDLPLQQLTDGARHSANRAGLVVCGGVAPAVAALRAKKALDAEVAELVRFAASERYLQIRSRRAK